MMIKYRAYFTYDPRIEVVEVERETENSVWIKGRRHAIITNNDRFCDTWEEAYDHLVKESKIMLHEMQKNYDYEYSRLQQIISLKKEDITNV